MEKTPLHLANQSKRAGRIPGGVSQCGIYLGELTSVLRTGSQYFSVKNRLLSVPELIAFSDADLV